MGRKILHKTKLIIRAIFNRVSKANIVCALPRSLIGLDIKRIPIVAWSSAFSRAFSRFPVLIMSSDWLTMMFFFVTIGRTDLVLVYQQSIENFSNSHFVLE